MRIGLFPTKNRSISKGVDSMEVVQEDPFVNQVFSQENGIKGGKQELWLDGARVILRNLSLDNLSTLEYENTHSCFGIHFLLEGNYRFSSKEDNTKLGINSGYYNLVQWPNVLGTQKHKGLVCVSVEVFFTKMYLQDLLGTEYHSDFESFLDVFGNYPKCLWGTGQPIPSRLRIMLLKILNCPYIGSSRTNYIESQMRCLVIDALLGRENDTGDKGESKLSILDYEAIEKVDSYIIRNLKEKLTIKELSEIAGFNTTKLKSCFKKMHQTTIFKYITRLRMEKAKKLILTDNLSIAQASYEVGYSNPQHFTVAFKKTMGYLPSALLGLQQ
ncbi:AraC family transcriptional regulator [Arenibacter sp. F26102]|uniref:helix-turn-helix domain-containing protein n=1 Tax=Arenibacter sp. F26102 TaxID=2926416 RepID=UPI001FF6D4B3|nr:helix-turn-helix domain-containing protein [Arenibacter sp. F26102]MCK0147876.1 AraC family transcriptional regulator [Arenibacter sp. F26102]